MVGNITFKTLGDADLYLRSQEHPPMSRRFPDMFPNLSLYILEIERSVMYQIVCIL